ncbi:Microtubule-associated protein-like [Rhynchospora pubera]|uniref:Microtubule-associated protein-like n=1 Tax=Rhynchospora pubera TaxID=906938 RepID=A0AAV8C1R2_9POAL|nr:Microtubule-associated protein-like [Rhynchospora pubera]
MTSLPKNHLSEMETTCETLLHELQVIWDEIGESDPEKDKMLLELERECLEVYRRRVDQSNKRRAQLRQAIADSEADLAAICSAMGERPVHISQSNQNAGGLREELKAIAPQLEEMKKRKAERWGQFLEIIEQIKKISAEIGHSDCNSSDIALDQSDLSMIKLEELTMRLQALQKEKSERLKQVFDCLKSLSMLCEVLGLDYKETVSGVHPSLDENEGSKCISDDTIVRLECAIDSLRKVKIQRMQKLQDLATTMLELWNLMDTPIEEQQLFQNVTCKLAASEHEITEPNTLSEDYISYVEAEVLRLEQLKASKMKDLVLKKKTELEEHRRRAHIIGEVGCETEFPIEAIEAGAIDPSLVLEQIEAQIAIVKEEAFSRKDILERIEKWLAACEEESWLEEYNKDENRYNAGRGAHLTLKRAEKARNLVSKIPAMVDNLAAKVTTWENERGTDFAYDGVRLLTMLEEYTILRQEKEQERKRQRDQKKLQGQLMAEQEALYGSKPSPSKPLNGKKTPKNTGVPNRRLSLGGAMNQHSKTDIAHSNRAIRAAKKTDEMGTLSPVSRGLDIAGLTVRKLSFNATSNNTSRESEVLRKPFSQVKPGNQLAPTTPVSKPLASIPADIEEENRPPKTVPIIASKTPIAAPSPSPMQVACTPAPVALKFEEENVKLSPEMEFSFEERRLALYLSR